jgi:bifunctional DNA-binding transcriptional regulator/antitoxin component of YhaV-PrlF toxin-antitoxin module
VTVPIAVRRQLALEAGDRLRWTVRDDGVVELEREDPVPLAAVAGMLAVSGARVDSVEEMDRGIARAPSSRARAKPARARRR